MVYQIRSFLCIAFLLFGTFVAAATEEKTTHQTFSLNEQGIVELSNVNGDVTVRGWDKNVVDMKATKRGPANQLDLVEIQVDSTPERFSVETKYPKRPKNIDVSVRYELMVPKRAKLDSVASVNGSIHVSSVEGEIRINTVNGSADIEGTKGSVDAETVNGNITAKWNEFPDRSAVKMHTVNGSLELQIPSNINADVEASSLNGSINTDFPISVQGRFKSRELQGRIGTGGTSIDLSTVNGSIDILKTQR